VSGIEWIQVEPGTAWLGDARGALMHASNGPRHQVRIETTFEISKELITFQQWRDLTRAPAAGTISDEAVNRLSPLMVMDLCEKLGDIRPPSEAEWALAMQFGAIEQGPLKVELLADRAPRSGFWGAPCDGRPWAPPTHRGGVSDRTAHITRVWNGARADRGATPREMSRPNMGFRLVRPVGVPNGRWYEGEAPTMPNAPHKSDLILREAVIALFVGVIPSFVWAFFNARDGYIAESWLNLVTGGVFVSALTALLWRPKSASWVLDGDKMRRS